MKRLFPWLILAFALLWLASNWQMPKVAPGAFDFPAFGKLPVLAGGRLKPLDTVARNSLMIVHGRQTLALDGKSLSAIHWLGDVLFNAPVADRYPVFVINNPEVLGLFGWQQGERKFFSSDELAPFLEKIDVEGRQAEEVEAAQRSSYQSAIFNLRNSLILYQSLKNSLQPEGAQNFTTELETYAHAVPAGLEEARKQAKGEPFDQRKLDAIGQLAKRYQAVAEMSSILAVPPAQGGDWISTGASLAQLGNGGSLDPTVKAYALIGDAYRANDPALFNQRVHELTAWMAAHQPNASGRPAFEFLFNHLAPFYQSMALYILVFVLVCASWLGWSEPLNRAAFYVLLAALAIHTFGLVARMILQGRPPVTNLYSAAIFIGWGTVVIGIILERIFRDGLGSASAAVIGFTTLIIAHHLAGSGDTLEMLRAVLDTNLWLATHVVTVTLGYSAMFLAGMLAVLYVIRGVFTPSLTRQAAQSLASMIYGVVCFATLFSFVGTVLGGIWADQSWGRFWGWDPKENGALLIVIWCAIILHARAGDFVRQRGLVVLALFGNVITSFSFLGVNMLGVGLHSYGFMDKAFPWLMGFMASQLALMGIAALPLDRWRSSQTE